MQRVDPADWKQVVAASVADGYDQFVTLMALDLDGVEVWLRLRNAAGVDRVLAAKAIAGVSTVIDLLPEAAWYEREAAEMYGIDFHGHATEHLLVAPGSGPVLARSRLLDARQSTPWPGEKEPGGAVPRRRQRPPGVTA